MKSITLNEAKNKLKYYGEVCKRESVIVNINGKPAFELVPYDDHDDDDDFMSDLIETNKNFREMLLKRKGEKTLTSDEVLRRIEQSERKAAKTHRRKRAV